MPVRRKLYEQTLRAVSSMCPSLEGFQDPEVHVPTISDEIVEEDTPWDPQDLTPKYVHVLLSLQRIKELCTGHGFAVPHDVWTVQNKIKGPLVALVLTDSDKDQSSEYKKFYKVGKTESTAL